jgi:holo-[acyl-carrier protein] synthase
MILGVGSDMVDIKRIERIIDLYGDRFLDRVFTEAERQKSEGRRQRAPSYAKRFAAKEACSKALGCGLGRGVGWRDMGVVNDVLGKPSLILVAGAAERLREMTPDGYAAQVNLSITDDYPLAQAIVIISAVPISAVQCSQ